MIVGCYIAYLTISVIVTIWVAQTLHKNGRIFLVDAFQGNEALGDSVNHLLVVGFYLINLGYITMALRTYEQVATMQHAIELVSQKIGVVLVILGLMHFFNIFLFNRARKVARRAAYAQQQQAPPVPYAGTEQ